MDKLSEALSKCYTGVVNDVMRDMGLKNFILPSDIRPIIDDKVIAGPVFTIKGKPTTEATAHETLLAWTGLLSKTKSGHIWVSQPNDHHVAHMGELTGETLCLRGIKGVVTDGKIRDVSFLRDMGLQVWCKGYTPADVVGYWLPDGFDVPITIGTVDINPGDYLLADRDGVIVLPKAHAENIVAAALEAIGKENKVRTAILNGSDPQEAYLTYGKF